jgi:radical SAM-linked protein
MDPTAHLGTLPVTARLPWDHIDVGLEDGFLAREYRKALGNRLSLPCGKVAGAFVHATNLEEAQADSRKLVCYDCGIACDLSAMREQRLVYLRKLGAEQPRPPAPPPRAGAARSPGAAVAFGSGPDAAAPVRARFIYEKLGAAAFLSHLDIVRALPRAFRRLDLPLAYSRGFHPKPDLTFGPALSLGVASLCEVVDVKLEAGLDPSTLLAELTAGSQPGLRFVAGGRLGPEDPGVTRVVNVARYEVAIAAAVVAERGGAAWLTERLAGAWAASQLVVVRRIDGIGKRVDVRDFLRSIAPSGEGGAALMARAGFVGDFVTVAVEVDVRGSGGVKIAEVIEATLGLDLPHRSVRVALGRSSNDRGLIGPLDLDALRPARTPKAIDVDSSYTMPG